MAAPSPDAPLPSGAAPIAERLAATTESLHAAVELWRAPETSPPPRQQRLWALHQQRLYLALGLASPQAGEAAVRQLPRELRANARDVLAARRALLRLFAGREGRHPVRLGLALVLEERVEVAVDHFRWATAQTAIQCQE